MTKLRIFALVTYAVTLAVYLAVPAFGESEGSSNPHTSSQNHQTVNLPTADIEVVFEAYRQRRADRLTQTDLAIPENEDSATDQSSAPATQNVFRFYNGFDHFYTMSEQEGLSAGYTLEATYKTYTTPAPGMVQIFRCLIIANGDHFVSRDSGCEGQSPEGSLGYLYEASQPNTSPWVRCIASEWLVARDANECTNAGYQLNPSTPLGYSAL